MRRRDLLAASGALALSASAQQAQPLPENVRADRDIVYAQTPQKQLLLDVFRPAEPAADRLPLVVWVHGGGWRQGSKGDGRRVHPLVATGHYVGAAINYRLSGDAIFPAQIHDCKGAIRWLRAHAGEYGVDPERIGVWGSSAGGHLVALLGTSGGVEKLEGDIGGNLDQSSRVQAVCDFFGPTDLLQMDQHSISDRIIHDSPDSPESRLIGAPIQDQPEKAAAANPITYITPDDPPFLIVHGDEDPLVPYHQSVLLYQALVGSDVPAALYKVEGGGHGNGGEFGSPELFGRVHRFFDSVLRS